MIRYYHLLLAGLILFSSLCQSAAASDALVIPGNASHALAITQPSVEETNFAEKRDFYVYGEFPGHIDHPGNIRIELFSGSPSDGRQVRLIESQVDPVNGTTNISSLELNYPEGQNRGNIMVPDLIKEPGGLFDPSNKVVVTNDYYLGLIQGGVTKGFDTTYRDRKGEPLEDLTAGRYTIRVTGLSGDFSGQVTGKEITFGLTDSMFGTDRPPVNLQNRLAYAEKHHLRVDRDWFPGYFFYPGYNNTGYAIPKRWNPNNGIESVNDCDGVVIDTPAMANNTLILYNMNEGSTSYGVELAAIEKYGLVDAANTTFLYYDTGEPNLVYRDLKSGTVENITGTLTPFPEGKRLVLTRAEIFPPDYPDRENIFDPWNMTTRLDVDYTVSDGFVIPTGYLCTLYGVTKPIPSTVTGTPTPYRYRIDNRILNLSFRISDDQGEEMNQSTGLVNLSRLFTNGSPDRYNSIFEFGHEIRLPEKPGNYTVRIEGFDISGNAVPGTEVIVPVRIRPLSQASL